MAEAAVHGPHRRAFFHGVGALDAIADIVGSMIAWASAWAAGLHHKSAFILQLADGSSLFKTLGERIDFPFEFRNEFMFGNFADNFPVAKKQSCPFGAGNPNVGFPSLRLGALIVPEGDSAPVERIKYLMDIGTSPFAQHLLLRVWRIGAVSRHLESRLPRLRAKLQDVFASCRKWLPADCEMVQPEAGLSFWVVTPVPTDLKFVDLCLHAGVLAMPGRAFETDVGLNGFQVHLEASDSRELDEGLRRIAQVIATLRRSGSKSQPQITSKSFP